MTNSTQILDTMVTIIDKLVKENRERFLKLVAELGGCPLLQGEIGWDSRQGDANFRFVSSLVRLFKMGLSGAHPINIEIRPDPHETTKLLLLVSLQIYPHIMFKLFANTNQLFYTHSIEDRPTKIKAKSR